MRQSALIGALIFAGTGAYAAPLPMSEDELKAAVAGKTVAIDTPIGFPITVNYGANGMMTGTAGTALSVYLGSAKDRGRWYVKHGKLCQKWFKWLGGDLTCLVLRQEGTKIYWRSDEGQTGTAMIETGPPVIEGASASGLGLPPQPEGVARAVAAREAAEPPMQPAPVAPKQVASAVRVDEPLPVPALANGYAAPVSRVGFSAEQPQPSETPRAEPELIESTRPIARPQPQTAEPWATRFAVASLAPTKASHQTRPVTAVPQRRADPFEADREPMRHAVDVVAAGAIEHRWCLPNAFARGPGLPAHLMADGSEPAPELIGVPSLVAVAQEQVYDGELPLHEPACLTAEPAIGTIAKLATVR